MRHRKKGRRLGRSSSHRKALMRNLSCALFLTEREVDEEIEENKPKVRGRIVTTVAKAKEVRPTVERCITIARRALDAADEAQQYATDAERNSDEWKQWRQSDRWRQWAQARAPYVAAQRRLFSILRDHDAVDIVFHTIAPRFRDRPGGYTRILRLATPRLGDAGPRAILELVGVHDRATQRAARPAFADQPEPDEERPADEEPAAADSPPQSSPEAESPAGEEVAAGEEK